MPVLKFNQNLGGFNVKTKTQKTASRRDFMKLTTAFAIANDTGGDIVFTANFKSARRLIEHWKAFKHARQRIIDRRHATRIAEV